MATNKFNRWRTPSDFEIEQAARMCLQTAKNQPLGPYLDSLIVVRNWDSQARARVESAIVKLKQQKN